MVSYVAKVDFGDYEDHTVKTLYVGQSRVRAEQSCSDFFPSDFWSDTYTLTIEVWDELDMLGVIDMGMVVRASADLVWESPIFISIPGEDVYVGPYFPIGKPNRNRVCKRVFYEDALN